jgi:phosphoglycerate dehydrogenase-like enzyme
VGLGAVEAAIVEPVLGAQINFVERPSAADLLQAEGAIVRAAYRIDEAALAQMPNLKVIARTGVGTEMVDLEACKARGVTVVITPGSNTNAVAEGVIAHALHLLKQIGPLTNLIRSGEWAQKDRYPVGDLEGQTIGIVGFGRIGQRVARLAEAFDMQVLAFDAYASIPEKYSVENLTELFGRSDVVSLHVPLTEKTQFLINQESLRDFKDTAVLINCGRGALVNLDHLHTAVLDKKISGVGLDVFDPEPPEHHPIFDLENVSLTPHVMGLSVKATEQTYIAAAQGIRDVFEGRQPAAVV